jgi:hypothetical protein
MLTCREFDDFIAGYREGELSLRTRLGFRLHLLFCRHCRAYLDGYERTVREACGAFGHPDDPVPGVMPEDLVRAIARARN